MDREKEEIIGSAMNYIKKSFGLEPSKLEGLEKALGELIPGVDEGIFRRDMMENISRFCRKDHILDK